MVRSTFIGIALFAAVLGSGFVACEGLVPSTSPSNTKTTDAVTTGGRVVYLDGQSGTGFFGIQGDDGRQYEPANLDVSYHIEGLRVKFSGQRDTTTLGDHAWGNPLEIARVESSK